MAGANHPQPLTEGCTKLTGPQVAVSGLNTKGTLRCEGPYSKASKGKEPNEISKCVYSSRR